MFKDPKTRRTLIMEHYSKPHNKSSLDNKEKIDVYSNECVDELHLHLDINDNKIIDAKWMGEGCAVFQSSTDIFLDIIKGKTLEEARYISSEFNKLISGEKADEKILGKLTIFDNIGKQLNRFHCANMILRGMKKAL